MSEFTKIEWCHHTFNPWWGCVKVSEECDNCYAERDSIRYGFSEGGKHFPIWGQGTRRRFFGDKHWAEPLKWNRKAEEAKERRRMFCASFADIMETHPDLTEPRQRLFDLAEATPWLDKLMLTKRPDAFRRFVPQAWLNSPRPDVWLGTTVGVRKSAWRIDALRETPAAVRFLSIEPLLEDLGVLDLCGIGWVIVGGESGAGARPMHPDWARSIRDQCKAACVPYFHKQNGEFASTSEVAGAGLHHTFPDGATVRRVGKKAAGRLLDGVEHSEFPRLKTEHGEVWP